MLEENPYIDKLYSIHKETTEVLAALKLEQYDLIIDLHHNIRTLRLKLQLGLPSTSYYKLNVEKWLLTNFKIDRLPSVHIVDRYLKTVASLGVINDGAGLDYFIPSSKKVDLKKLDSRLTSKHFIVFAIGAKYATKRLPTSKIIEIIHQINLPVVLIGGKEDQTRANEVEFAERQYVINAVGLFSFHQSASVIAQSKALITHDTGMMHIGAALHTPIISVWGNTVPKLGMYPYYPNNQKKYVLIENQTLKCRPCSKIGYNKCPKGHFNCMSQIDVSTITKSLKSLITDTTV